jgi:formyltetrahydrofolate-dependent phosphoribosylglycinamide formyltransferase
MTSPPARRRIAVLASGGGSNLQALLDHLDALGERRAADVVLVASDRAAAGALERARRRGVPAHALDTAGRTTGLPPLLRSYGADLVVLAGYLRLVPNEVTRGWRGRIVNVHPALLPAFGGPGMYGERVHAAVLASGARVSGVTVHFVDEEYDRGAIIAQWPVPVHPGDTPHLLAERVLAVEHLLYPRVVQGLAAGDVRLRDDGRVEGWTIPRGVFTSGDGIPALRQALDSEPGNPE